MKFILLFLPMLLVFTSCQKSGQDLSSSEIQSNDLRKSKTPTVIINSPLNLSSVSTLASLKISVSATLAIKIAIFVNGSKLCEGAVSPVSCYYKTPASSQTLSIEAVATSSSNQVAKQIVSVKVVEPAPTPMVNNIEVYPGCEAIGSTTRTITLDGNLGETLQNAFDKNLIAPGDKVIVKGFQGSLQINKYTHPSWVNTNAWISIEGQNAFFSNIDMRDVGRFHFKNIKIMSKGKNLFALSAARNIVLTDSSISADDDSSAWGAADWLVESAGIYVDNSVCTSFLRNNIKNVRFAINVFTRGTTVDSVMMNSLIQDNEIRNVSADFIRPIGSNITVKGNKAFDGYLSELDGDTNHDDFIQGFALNGVPYSNVKIIDNYFNQNTSSSRKWKTEYQGICVFDGVYSNFLIQGNTVIGSAYHGIAIYGGQNGIIENNTLASDFPNFARNYWIHTPPLNSLEPSVGVVVRNNIANQILQTSGVSYSNNAVIIPSAMSANVIKYDVINGSYDLNLRTDSIYYNKNIGDQTPQ